MFILIFILIFIRYSISHPDTFFIQAYFVLVSLGPNQQTLVCVGEYLMGVIMVIAIVQDEPFTVIKY